MNEQQKPVLKFAINWGVILGMVMIALSLLFYLLGLQENKTVSLLSFGIFVVVMYFAQKSYRDQNAGIYIGFGRALWVGFAAGLFSTILMATYNYLFYEFISPDLLTKMIENAQLQVIEMDLPGDVETKALESQLKFMTSGWIAIFSVFGSIIQSFIAALIGAMFVKGTTPADETITDFENQA